MAEHGSQRFYSRPPFDGSGEEKRAWAETFAAQVLGLTEGEVRRLKTEEAGPVLTTGGGPLGQEPFHVADDTSDEGS